MSPGVKFGYNASALPALVYDGGVDGGGERGENETVLSDARRPLGEYAVVDDKRASSGGSGGGPYPAAGIGGNAGSGGAAATAAYDEAVRSGGGGGSAGCTPP